MKASDSPILDRKDRQDLIVDLRSQQIINVLEVVAGEINDPLLLGNTIMRSVGDAIEEVMERVRV
jgi:hypothetical protein